MRPSHASIRAESIDGWKNSLEVNQIAEAFQKCADVRLPEDFADSLVKRLDERGESAGTATGPKTVFARIALVAASLTLLLGFVSNAFDGPSAARTEIVVHLDEIRPAEGALPQDGQLNALAFLGFCREVIRRRVRSLLSRDRKREE